MTIKRIDFSSDKHNINFSFNFNFFKSAINFLYGHKSKFVFDYKKLNKVIREITEMKLDFNFHMTFNIGDFDVTFYVEPEPQDTEEMLQRIIKRLQMDENI